MGSDDLESGLTVRKYNPDVWGTDEDVAECDKDGSQLDFHGGQHMRDTA